MQFSSILKGAGEQYEITRVLGAFGVAVYVVAANAFVAWDVFVMHRSFDVTAYCLAFPTGLGAAIGAVAGSAALKDRGVATAKVISDTNSLPGKPEGPSA